MPVIQDFDDPTYDPFTAAVRMANAGEATNIYPELARLRREGAIHELDIRTHFGTAQDITTAGQRQWTVLGHREVTEILMDFERFSNSVYESSLGVAFGRTITIMDPPDHRKFRVLFQRAFTPPAIAEYGRTIVPNVIGQILDGLASKGRAELNTEFALQFPFHFINELLQLPVEDRKIFHRLAFSQVTVRFDPVHGVEGGQKLRAYLAELIKEREGSNDLVGVLAQAEVDGERLPEEILVSFLRQLMNAGGDTTYHGFGSVLTQLLTRPALLEEIKADRSLVSPAIEECLRLEAPTNIIERTPKVEVSMAGVTMYPGDVVRLSLGSANRDETVYDRPDELDVRRPVARHSSFGFGPHVCIGAHLARLEMNTALNMLLDRLPNLRLDPDFPPPVVKGAGLRGPTEVRVLFDAA